ncbi:carboxypeptidase regulatory-like domain-containing protein [Massilia sp. CCM 8734]|uniref:carboxypeptidase regulatory-like domain-containing protein n=1 Tax=Massilia sp. CCM 8734 TaxID=2609283 RepID=UPI0014231B70|nr:carboxypeptidase regulatory-like domain-containing protein [Massilia sp. CCM 8734]NHZ96960.1 hypothetical protein [Massilia sp. CCM 8734]
MPKPTYPSSYDANLENDYAPYIVDGTAEISGQAFLVQKGGGTVKAAGRTVTLDPVTTISQNWWMQAGRVWKHRASLPPSAGFTKARRTVTADADGRFKFTRLPAGFYYVRSELTWTVPFHGVQGGLLTSKEDVTEGEVKTIMLNGAK